MVDLVFLQGANTTSSTTEALLACHVMSVIAAWHWKEQTKEGSYEVI